MRITAALVLAGLCFPIESSAQSAAQPPAQPAPKPYEAPKNPVSDFVRDALGRSTKNLVAAAELLPPEKYDFHPTPDQMTFGALIAHIVETNDLICSGIAGSAVPEGAKLPATEKKDVLVAGMKQSFDYCAKALAGVTDAQLADEVVMGGRHTGLSRAAAMIIISNDWADHYSTAASYLRLNGILPPTAKPKK